LVIFAPLFFGNISKSVWNGHHNLFPKKCKDPSRHSQGSRLLGSNPVSEPKNQYGITSAITQRLA
jgi:hypothetical protein